MQPKLLIGMSTFDDFDGAYFTVQALRLYHPEAMPLVEIAIVDNNPGGAHSKAIQEFLGWVKGDVADCHYVPFAGEQGTSAPRHHIFSVGSAPFVLVLDSHVMLVQGAIHRLIEFFERTPDTRDLYQGPMLYDDLRNFSTHFKDVWGSDQMWGRWGTDLRAAEPSAEPFEIGAMGLGLFACRRDAWPGFNPRFRGFGSEEWYIHEKFRKEGHKIWCLPWLRWLHRFGRPSGVKYKLDIWDKARNYVVGLTELGIPLDRAREAFVGGGKIKPEDWDRLVANSEYRPMATGCTSLDNRVQPKTRTLEELYEVVKKNPRDLDQHADYVREITTQAKKIVAFVKRKEWNVILANARPQSLTVYQKEEDALLAEVHRAVKAEEDASARSYSTVVGPGADSLVAEIEPCDLLIIDSIHQYARLLEELQRHAHKVSSRILVRATGIFGERDEGADGPGLLAAIRKWVKDRPEWTVIHHTNEQYGMTLLSRDDADKTPLPSLWQQGLNVAKASWRAGANVLQGFGALKDTPEHDGRLALCLICPNHNQGRCAVCGCPIDKKASWPTEKCPIGKWSEIDASKLPLSDVQPSAQSPAPVG